MSILLEGPVLPFVALAWPLLLGGLMALPPVRDRALMLLPLAPLPALALALMPLSDQPTEVPGLLLGVRLETEPLGMGLLGMTAALWLAAGLYALAHMKAPRKPAIFSGFWCLTLAGNLGVYLAADAVTFYVAFAAVSLASYFLVVHSRTAEALRASSVYIIMAVIGEAMLLTGFILMMAQAETFLIADMRDGLMDPGMGNGQSHVTVAMLVIGFGIKTGLMPLHVWLPLAHPAAPVAASAVLSGAIVNAGLIGLIRFLPEGGTIAAALLLVLGLIGVYAGAVIGVLQQRIKAVLAYSTVSQMGLILAVVGAGLLAAGDPSVETAGYYGIHHGLAKGALFLAVGWIPLLRGSARWMALALVAMLCASVAGWPMTGGGLAKAAIKPVFPSALAWVVTATGVTTTCVLMRYLFLLVNAPSRDAAGEGTRVMGLTVATIGLAALTVPWVLWSTYDPRPMAYVMGTDTLRNGAWPVVAGLALAALAWRLDKVIRVRPAVPEGDLLVAVEAMLRSLASGLNPLAHRAIGQRRPASGSPDTADKASQSD
ncbi:complex I subunit 5 family protein [Spiribacter vilamensis]|uniref:Formate hydrogenlyase subunit 3/multisubunit Na+/H+ antiporter MnhD subunit n=1 Tax=Spiribacter vilamensis TaxID=531306 RepID=A0A4Q8D2U4_9GAMM|nr:complex I subunit 5 family protein [Spiribacter vilamensis]RZU99726.1 formate hydrogenlyase subunit 3/multisubunit Na+/H+ antiporter MnhD subunit [Spiribacter vilamensis]TVO61328.1 NADH/ubiquinone/plastoquinone (complex I) [Spiribacter vilamensis]